MSAVSPAACFSQSHHEARNAFLRACTVGDAAIVSHRHPLAGPDGADLFLDEARFGPADARRVLFVASGTHGIEGFCGSGIQTFLLGDGLARRLPADVALVFVHAVNPWGFAWLRRVNEDNVDINRNFLDHDAPHPENPDYDALYEVLNPPQLDDAAIAKSLAAVAELQRTRGATAVYRALSGGQYRHPKGVQYGGTAPVWSNRTLREVWKRQSAQADLAVNVDLHSGLGPCGVGLLFQTSREVSADAHLARAWWPDVVRAEPSGGGDAALASGLMGPAFTRMHSHAPGVAVVLEFGTREFVQVMRAIQADNWLHHHGSRSSEAGQGIVRQMRDAFFLEDEEWKEKVCRRAVEVVDRGLAGMEAFAPEAERE